MTINSISLHFLQEHPKDAARALEQFDPKQLASFLQQVPVRTAATVIKYLVPAIAAECIKNMDIDRSSQIIMKLGVERAALLLRRMKTGFQVQFIRAMTPVFANMTRLVLRYPVGTVGHVMNPNVLTVHEDMTIREVTGVIRNFEELSQNEIFVTGARQELRGIVNMRQLLTDDDKQSMKKIMHTPGQSIPARAALDNLRDHSDWNLEENIPVVDHLGEFIGVLDRKTIHESLFGKVTAAQDNDFGSTAMDLAELFWHACAHLLAQDYQNATKDQNNERD
jgi:Mg/Co/Ni transporter MgtE